MAFVESSSNDSDSETENRDPSAPSKKVRCEWNPVMSFDSKEALEKYIDSHDCFYQHSSNSSNEGTTTYYYCSMVAARSSTHCPVKLKVFENNTTLSFGVSVTTMIHDHSTMKLKKNVFSDAVKTEIFTLKTTFAMKPRLICKQLQRTHKNEPLPTVPQIRRIIQEQNEIRIPETVSYGQLYEWCETQKSSPEDIDEAFVLDHFGNSKEDSLAIVVSTKRLLKNSVGRQNVCTDGTYKIMWQDFPIIVVGFLDRANHFHATALCLTARERTIEYEFVFNAIQNAAKKFIGADICPKVVVSDAAPAIRNAFYSSFESAEQNVICYIHVQRNISKYKYQSKDNKDLIMADFMILKDAGSKNEFDEASGLFLAKWRSAEPEFCQYFESEWLDEDTQNWYAGYSDFVPNHNNAQEGFNNHIKRDHTLRERLPLNTFKVKFMQMVSDMSACYDPRNTTGLVKKIIDRPEVTDQMLQTGYSWYVQPNLFFGEKIYNKNTNTQNFIVPSSKYLSQTDSGSIGDLCSTQKQTYDSFDDYVSNGLGLCYKLSMKCDKKTCFMESTCTCIFFHKKFICKHIIGLACHLHLMKRPQLTDNKIIGKKQSRGRSAKAKKALNKQ